MAKSRRSRSKRRGRCAEGKGIHHHPRILRTIYGDRIQTLYDFITDTLGPSFALASCSCSCSSSPCPRCDPSSYILRDEDTADFWSLLNSSYTVPSDSWPSLPTFSLENRWTQSQIIQRAVELQFRKGSKADSVICFGYRLAQPKKARMGSLSDSNGLECVNSNVAIQTLNSQSWMDLLPRVGDTFMLHLLQHTSLFHELPNQCFLQLSGVPVDKLLLPNDTACSNSYSPVVDGNLNSVPMEGKFAKQDKKTTVSYDPYSVSKGNANQGCCERDTNNKRKISLVSDQLDVQCKRKKYDNLKRPCKRGNMFIQNSLPAECKINCENLKHVGETIIESKSIKIIEKVCPMSENPFHERMSSSPVVTKKEHKLRKRQRPFKWQRRKRYKACKELHFNDIDAITDASSHECLQSNSCHEIPLHSSRESVHGECKETDNSMEKPFLVKEHASIHCDQVKMPHCGKVNWLELHANNSGPADIVISRRPIFYNAGISQCPGFLNSYILSTGRPNVDGAKSILRKIFGLPSCFDDLYTHWENGKGESECLNSHRNKNILTMVKILIRRAQHCQYKRLLNEHCPVKSKELYEVRHFSRSKTSTSNMRNIYKSIKQTRQSYAHSVVFSDGSKDWAKSPADNGGYFHQQSSQSTANKTIHNNQPKYSRVNHQVIRNEVNQNDKGKCFTTPNDLLQDLITSYSTYDEVLSFVWSVVRRIIPITFLGSKHNWRKLRQNIANFIRLKRFESFTLQHCLYKLRMSEFSFIHGFQKLLSLCCCSNKSKTLFCRCKKGEKQKLLQQKVFEAWIFWLFSEFIVPLISNHFYVTESEIGRCDIFYYRKDLWHKASKVALNDLRKCNYKKLSLISLEKILKSRNLGYSRIRFLPKSTGIRPIANLGAPSRISFSCDKQAEAPITKIVQDGKKPSIYSTRANRGSVLMKHHEKYVRYNTVKSIGIGLSLGNLNIHQNSQLDNRRYRQTRCISKSFKSINYHLYNVHQSLKCEQQNSADALGCSVFDYNDIYQSLIPFIATLRDSSCNQLPYYIVVCDVTKAFDTVSHDKLISVMHEVLERGEYKVQKYTKIFRKGESARALRLSCPITTKDDNLQNNVVICAARNAGSIFIDQAFCARITRDEIINLLTEHVKRNILKIGHNFYVQKLGISQGSILSSLLCSFYYGHLEKNKILPLLNQFQGTCVNSSVKAIRISDDIDAISSVSEFEKSDAFSSCRMLSYEVTKKNCLDLSPLSTITANMYCDTAENLAVDNVALSKSVGPNSLLLRLIDDSIFISTSKDAASSFVQIMHRGFEEYNCYTNIQKCRLNFDIELQGRCLPKNIYRTDDGSCFMPWAGLLINVHSLEIQADYTRYCNFSIRSTITVSRQRTTGIGLSKKLCAFMRPKCHPIFYDQNINSAMTVKLNGYQAFLICAMKFHAYVRAIPLGGQFSARYILKAIMKATRYFYRLLGRRMRDMSCKKNIHPKFAVHLGELEWLSLSAFSRVLSKKQTVYQTLLILLEKQKRSKNLKTVASIADLHLAIDDSRSSMFWKMRY